MRDLFEMIVIPAFSLVIVIFLLAAPIAWFSAKNEAILYNQKFNTKYTTSQFFWAGETIKSFLNEGKQTTQNINFNGMIPLKIEKDLGGVIEKQD